MANKKAPLPHHPPGFDAALEALLIDLGEARKPGDKRTRSERQQAGELAGIVDLLSLLAGLRVYPREAPERLDACPKWTRVRARLLELVTLYLGIPSDTLDPFEVLERCNNLKRGPDPLENRFELPDGSEALGLDAELACWKDEPGFANWPGVAGRVDPSELVLDRLAGEVGRDPMPDALARAWLAMASLHHAKSADRLELLAYQFCEALREIAMLQRSRAGTLAARHKANLRGDSGGARASELFALQYLEARYCDAAGRVRKKTEIAREIQALLLERNTRPCDWNPSEENSLRTIKGWITAYWRELKAYQRADDLIGERLRERRKRQDASDT